ncbi:MAG: YlxR family protein [Fimbriimonas sp.]
MGCRRSKDQDSLLRVAKAPDGRVTTWKGSGRSAYICPDPNCIEAALAKVKLDRALRTRVSQEDIQALRTELICKLR